MSLKAKINGAKINGPKIWMIPSFFLIWPQIEFILTKVASSCFVEHVGIMDLV